MFVELFCTPKSSTENPSLQVNRHGGHTSRTFIVEDCSEDDFGHWATDEVTGEQGYTDDERSYFWTSDDSVCAWQSRPFKSRQVNRRKVIWKGKGKGRSKKTRRAFCGEEIPLLIVHVWFSREFRSIFLLLFSAIPEHLSSTVFLDWEVVHRDVIALCMNRALMRGSRILSK